MTNTHTPGPWMVERRTTSGQFVTDTHVVANDGSHIALVSPCAIEANAALIAAAPEMLDALYAILNIEGSAIFGAFDGLDVPWHFDKVRAAIAKAERW